MNAPVVLIVSLAIAATGGGIAWWQGVGKLVADLLAQRAKLREADMARRKADQDSRDALLAEYHALLTKHQESYHALEERSLSNEQRMEREIAALQKRLRIVEEARDVLQARIDELELENAQLKARMYDLERPNRPHTASRKSTKPTPLRPQDHA